MIMRDRLPRVPVLLDGMAADIARSFETVTAGGPLPLSVFGENVGRARPGDMDEFTRGVVIVGDFLKSSACCSLHRLAFTYGGYSKGYGARQGNTRRA